MWLAVLPAASPVAAADVVLGRIVAVEPETGQIRLEVADSSGIAAPAATEDGKKIVVLAVGKEELTAKDGRRLRPGDMVRVWGDFIQDQGRSLFRVQRLAPAGAWGRRADPTGVRARLGRSGRATSWARGRGTRKGGRH